MGSAEVEFAMEDEEGVETLEEQFGDVDGEVAG